ncbi:disease resistance-like protein DSC1 [Mangifera indica]|uniref:disease resistance-like protein DSC1 n=1 Tax=Mangifera indica TaxID=29780 RepID=UPI001CF9813A|nr:disease resistance-like protein DSC1 [Mangifera indica]XP_044509968.1 disease resistance-like protein DSC1 [Mangifera indica]XP_044509969.1 disease resistance-like protein DSC1 [Mangifera indica]
MGKISFMASSLSLSSCNSISHRDSKFDVFLSFRGEDTRDNFTSHLYAALRRKQIEAFIDDRGLKRGDEISPVLLKAIESSKISVIIFSEDYASSRWCLDELVKILECKKFNNQIVIPVFFNVNPSDIRKQTGTFAEAFVKHEERFKEMRNKVQNWRNALTEAANLSGWDSSVTKPEATLVDEIVKDILKKLKNISISSDSDYYVGLNSRIKHIKSLLCIGLSDFRIIGIWGMGGIGKTTIAGAIFNQISCDFEGCYFCINVREESEKWGLSHLRDQVLSQILEEENLKIGTPKIPLYIQERLRRKKVFIVLDDVNNFEQLEFLGGGLDHFGLGSRIIITTRDKQVLHSYGVQSIYEVEELNHNEALLLFCKYAFKQCHPLEDFMELSSSVINYAKGNPLALKALGSTLFRKSRREWESAMYNLKMVFDPQIHDVLKISYDRLNREEKEIFLDIACFFKGEDIDDVAQIMLDSHYSLYFELRNLCDKSLITISNNKLQMHDLLQEMGREIVFQESAKEPAKRSRLWYHEDVYNMLKNNKGTDSIEGTFLDMSKIRELQLSSGAFANMSNLRLLKFYTPKLYKVFSKAHLQFLDISKVHLPHGLKYLPNELRYLHWEGYPLKKLPSKFNIENLVELRLPYSKVEQLWKGTKHAPKLKLIDLRGSRYLTRISDLSDASMLEVMNLRYCKSLKIFPKISGNIKELDLSATRIEEIPTAIRDLKSLSRLKLWNCSKLKSFPEIFEEIKNLQYFSLGRATKVKQLPSSIEYLTGLIDLTLVDLKNLETIPSNIFRLTSLCSINLSGCSKLDRLPDSLGNLKCLWYFNADRTAIRELPSSIAGCKDLRVLHCSKCRSLILPSFSVLGSLTQLSLSYCSLTIIPEDICYMPSLKLLDLSGNNLKSLPRSVKQLSRLKHLLISNCRMIQSLPELPVCLRFLDARNCKKLQSLPHLPSRLEELNADELELVFERCCQFAYSRIEFIFTNCLQLNQKACNSILVDSQLQLQHMSSKSLRLCHEKVYEKTPSTSLCLPGSKIPDWFSYQSSGSSITIVLPQHWCNKKFIGFALCVVIAFEWRYCGRGLFVDSTYQFQTSDNQWDPSIFGLRLSVAGIWAITAIDSEHIVLGYSPVRVLKGEYTAASFKFRPFIHGYKGPVEGCKVKYCGVSLLYTQPIVIQSNLSIENLAPMITRKRHANYYPDQTNSTEIRSGGTDGELEPVRAKVYTRKKRKRDTVKEAENAGGRNLAATDVTQAAGGMAADKQSSQDGAATIMQHEHGTTEIALAEV